MPRAFVVDANLFLLLAVGATSVGLIGVHKRLRAFTSADLYMLDALLAGAERLIVTPNVLTETSNLAMQIGEPARTAISHAFAALVSRSTVVETYVPSMQASQRSEFARLGLTDAGLLQILGDAATLVTADLDLYLAAVRRGFKAVNFNHLREQRVP